MKANTIILSIIFSAILSIHFLYGQVNIPDKQIPHPRILLTEEEKTQLVKMYQVIRFGVYCNKIHWKPVINFL
jgi:hypothetical protein